MSLIDVQDMLRIKKNILQLLTNYICMPVTLARLTFDMAAPMRPPAS